MALAMRAKPEHVGFFSKLALDGDLRIRSAATYGLFRCAPGNRFLAAAIRSLEAGMEIDYYGTDETIHHEDPEWRSAVGYVRSRFTSSAEEALVQTLRRDPPAFIQADILRCFLLHQTAAGLDHSRTAMAAEGDGTAWKYIAWTILAFGTPVEKRRLLALASTFTGARMRLFALPVAEELASFRLPFAWAEVHPSVASAVVRALRESCNTSGPHGHVIDHLRGMAERYEREQEDPQPGRGPQTDQQPMAPQKNRPELQEGQEDELDDLGGLE